MTVHSPEVNDLVVVQMRISVEKKLFLLLLMTAELVQPFSRNLTLMEFHHVTTSVTGLGVTPAAFAK